MCNQIQYQKILRSAYKVDLCVPYGSQNKQQLEEDCLLMGCLLSEYWQFLTDVSGQSLGPIFMGHKQRLFHYIALTNYVVS
jgi:hypothetical protein